MRIAVACDHAGLPLKPVVLDTLRRLGHEAVDLGTNTPGPVDYPDIAEAAGRAVLSGQADRAIVLCGSGVGAAVAANKLAGIRAGVCHDSYSARQSVEHDDVNVLSLGARVVGPSLVETLVESFLGATFSGEARHVRRLEKIAALERRRS